jgi:hypothetical protein
VRDTIIISPGLPAEAGEPGEMQGLIRRGGSGQKDVFNLFFYSLLHWNRFPDVRKTIANPNRLTSFYSNLALIASFFSIPVGTSTHPILQRKAIPAHPSRIGRR